MSVLAGSFPSYRVEAAAFDTADHTDLRIQASADTAPGSNKTHSDIHVRVDIRLPWVVPTEYQMFGDVRLDAREPRNQFVLDKPLGCERLSGGEWLKPELVEHACLAFAQSAYGIEEPLHERVAGSLVIDEVVNQEIRGHLEFWAVVLEVEGRPDLDGDGRHPLFERGVTLDVPFVAKIQAVP